MKKFIATLITGMIFTANVMATAPAPVSSVIPDGSFSKISFEASETINWNVSGTNASYELVSSGVADGFQAIKLSMNSRTDDWGDLTSLTLTAPKEIPWNFAPNDKLKATLTNQQDFDFSIRINITDAFANNRLVFFTIPANSTQEIVIDKEVFGEPGVVKSKWGPNGYSQKGVNMSAIKAIRFNFAEPDPKFANGLDSASLIIDNIYVEKGPVDPNLPVISNTEVSLPVVGSNFPITSFEDGSAVTWRTSGPAHIVESVPEGATQGTKALKFTITQRSVDWNNRNYLNIIPKGEVWNMGSATSIVASVTNPLDVPIQIKCDVSDTSNNTRMMYFAIPAKSTREIVMGPEQLGVTGVKNSKWSSDGYDYNGIDRSAIDAISFYMPEPDTKQMPGITSPVYIIDNITIR